MTTNLDEARRNPDVNTKNFNYTDLLKYKGEDDVFVSFTSSFSFKGEIKKGVKGAPSSQHKIGINPQSPYNTPFGIYCYPVDYVLNYSKNRDKIDAPFTGGGRWEFLYVLRRKPNMVAIYNDEQAEPYYEKMKQMVTDAGQEQMIQEAQSNSLKEGAKGELWNLSRIYADYLASNSGGKGPVQWNKIMRELGIAEYVDAKHEGIIHNNEETQAVFFSLPAFTVVDVLMRDDKSNTGNELHIHETIKRILKGTYNYNSFNPIRFRTIYGSVANDQKEKFITNLAENLPTLSKKVIGDYLSTRPVAGAKQLELLAKFGPVKITPELFSIYNGDDSGLQRKYFSSIPEAIGRKLTLKEWSDVFKGIVDHGMSVEKMRSMLTAIPLNDKADFVTRDWLKTILDTRYGYAKPDEFVPPIIFIASAFNIEMDDDLKKSLFIADPELIVDKLKYIPQDYDTWLKMVRTYYRSIKNIVQYIPKPYLKTLVNKARYYLIQSDILGQIIEDGDVAFFLKYIRDNEKIGDLHDPILMKTIMDNLDTVLIQKPDAINYIRPDAIPTDWKPSYMVFMSLARYIINTVSYDVISLIRKFTSFVYDQKCIAPFLINPSILRLFLLYADTKAIDLFFQRPPSIIDLLIKFDALEAAMKKPQFFQKSYIDYLFEKHHDVFMKFLGGLALYGNKTDGFGEFIMEHPDLLTDAYGFMPSGVAPYLAKAILDHTITISQLPPYERLVFLINELILQSDGLYIKTLLTDPKTNFYFHHILSDYEKMKYVFDETGSLWNIHTLNFPLPAQIALFILMALKNLRGHLSIIPDQLDTFLYKYYISAPQDFLKSDLVITNKIPDDLRTKYLIAGLNYYIRTYDAFLYYDGFKKLYSTLESIHPTPEFERYFQTLLHKLKELTDDGMEDQFRKYLMPDVFHTR